VVIDVRSSISQIDCVHQSSFAAQGPFNTGLTSIVADAASVRADAGSIRHVSVDVDFTARRK
jgi:hypothetical protein